MSTTLPPSHPDVLELWRGFNEERRDGLYSTDSPAILGLSRWGTPRSVYLEKVEPAELGSPMSMQAFLGLELEDALAAMWHERYPEAETPKRVTQTFWHPVDQWIRTHLDFISSADGVTFLLECKTRQKRTSEWGEDGSSKVPVDIWVQVQHQMLVMGVQLTYVCVLFGLHTFQVHPIERDETFLSALVPKLSSFWQDNVLAGVEPPLTSHRWDSAYVQRLEQEVKGFRSATPEVEKLLRDLKAARLNVKQAKAAEVLAGNQLREFIGNAEGVRGVAGEVSWRKSKDSVKTEWKAVADTYASMVRALLELANPGDDPEAVALLATIQTQLPLVPDLYTRLEPGSRRFLPTFPDEEDDDSE